MDNQKINYLRDLINLKLDDLAKVEKLQIHVGNAKYTDNSVTFQLVIVEGETALDAERAKFNDHCDALGLKPEHFGTVIVSSGIEYKLCGLKPGSPKYPIIAKDKNGKRFKFRIKTIRKISTLPDFNFTDMELLK